MKTDELIAIDVHTHAEVSCRQPTDEVWQAFEDAPSKSPDRWIKDFKDAGFKPEVHELILKENAIAALGLGG